MNTIEYKKFKRVLDNFFSLCEENNILARKNWTCCNSCGNAEIGPEKDIMEKQNNKKYMGYIFYHTQEADSIYSQCKKEYNYNNQANYDNTKIQVYLSWGYFDDNEYEKDSDGKLLGDKIKNIAEKTNAELEFTDFSKKLILKINIDE